jgi:hypothetical protein
MAKSALSEKRIIFQQLNFDSFLTLRRKILVDKFSERNGIETELRARGRGRR